jgi:hypothetical protein
LKVAVDNANGVRPVAQHTHLEHHLVILYDGSPRHCYVAGERMQSARSSDMVGVFGA